MVYGTRKDTEPAATTGITWPHNTTTLGEMSSSGGGFGLGVGVGVGVAGGPTLAAAQQGQGVAALLVMLAVLCFIFAYCCWGAPFCRSLCRRYCCCRLEDPEPDQRFGNSDQAMVATPTIILLPHGRMLVVDGTIFTQFQTDTTGLDLVELGDSMIRAQRNPRSLNRHQLQSSQGSILEMDAETPSKDSLGSIGCFPPPTYESIYGKEESDMPPSYSDILLHRFVNLPHEIDIRDYYNDGKEEIEMQSLESCPHIAGNPMNALTYPYTAVTSISSQSFPRRNVSRNPSIISNPLDNYYMDNELEIYRLDRGMVSVSRNANSIATWESCDVMRNNENGNENRNQNENDSSSRRMNDQTEDNVNRTSETDNATRIVGSRQANIINEVTSISTATENETMNMKNRARSITRIVQRDERRNCENLQRANERVDIDLGTPLYLPPDDMSRSNVIDPTLDRFIRHDEAETSRISQTYTDEQPNLRNILQECAQSNVVNCSDATGSDAMYSSRHARNSEDSLLSEGMAHVAESQSIYSDDDGENFGALADIRESRV